MSHPIWKLLPRTGIENDSIEIIFGMKRQDLRGLMSHQFSTPKSHFPDEDDFVSANQSTVIRIRYEDGVVRDIEFLDGVLSYQAINLHSETTLSELEEALKASGFTLRSTEWLGSGQDCPELGLNIASRKDVGGNSDQVEWVILSRNFH